MNLGEYFAKTRGTGILATSDDWGKRLYEAWAATGKGEPTVMAEVAKEIAPPRPVRPHRVPSQTNTTQILSRPHRGVWAYGPLSMGPGRTTTGAFLI